MQKILFSILFAFSLSCTKAEPPSPVAAATPPGPEVVSAKMPSIEIAMADRACEVDADCTHIPTQCSCSCGQGVHREKAQPYSDQLKGLCSSYQGVMCKVLCKGQVKCQQKICTYVE